MNTVLATGASHDLELRYTPGGLAVVNARVSGTRTVTTHTGERKEVFSTVGYTVFGNLAELISDTEPGTPLLIAGRLSYRTWEQDGQKRSSLDVIADNVRRLNVPAGRIKDGEYSPLLEGCRNEANIIGNLTRDAQVRYGPSGIAILNYSLAVNEWDPKNKTEKVHYVDCTAFGELAEHYGDVGLSKGQSALARGSLRLNSWTPSDGGPKRYRLQLTAEDMESLARIGNAPAGTSSSAGRAKPASTNYPQQNLDIDEEFPPEEDLPF